MNGSSYTYGNQPHAVTQVGTTSYAYDANGNMVTRGDQTIGWDVENRVISVTGGASFIYDGDGNRVKKTENDETILYINQYYEKNITTGVVTTSYYLGGKLVAQREDTTLRYIHQDSLNSTSVMTDSSGALDSSMSFYPFGEGRSGYVNTEKKFTGQRLDDTGLYYYGARYYDAGIGRFISADTVVQSPGNPQTLNRYSYCVNNPLKYVDPSGYGFVIGEDEQGHVIQMDSKGNVSPNATPPAPNPPNVEPAYRQLEMPIIDKSKSIEGGFIVTSGVIPDDSIGGKITNVSYAILGGGLTGEAPTTIDIGGGIYIGHMSDSIQGAIGVNIYSSQDLAYTVFINWETERGDYSRQIGKVDNLISEYNNHLAFEPYGYYNTKYELISSQVPNVNDSAVKSMWVSITPSINWTRGLGQSLRFTRPPSLIVNLK